MSVKSTWTTQRYPIPSTPNLPWSPLSWEGDNPAGRWQHILLSALKQGHSLLIICKDGNTPLLYLMGVQQFNTCIESVKQCQTCTRVLWPGSLPLSPSLSLVLSCWTPLTSASLSSSYKDALRAAWTPGLTHLCGDIDVHPLGWYLLTNDWMRAHVCLSFLPQSY